MDERELEGYAKILGFTTAAADGAEAKADLIEKRREKVADLTILGIAMKVPVKRAHDRRFLDEMSEGTHTMEDLERSYRFLLGDQQYDELVRAVTDVDGTVDDDALAYAFNAILVDPELKNF